MHVLGIDIGTTSISIVLLDEASGSLIARETVNHGAFMDDACPAGRIQDPEKIWNIVKKCCDRLASAHGRPACIGLTGQMHGIMYVDGNGRAVSPLYTWQDGRGNLDMGGGVSYAAFLRENGLSAAAGYGLTTHFYLMKNGLLPANAAKATTISDYIVMKLCGNTEPVLGADMAASWGCFDLEKRAFRTDIMEALGFDTSVLPELAAGHGIAGYTKEGIPVTVSRGDNQASVLGSVQDVQDSVLINIGTGSQVSVGTDAYVACAGSIELRPCTQNSYLLVGSGLCGGRAYAMLEQFYRQAAGTDEARYAYMLDQAEDFIERFGADAAWKVRTTFSGTRDNPGEKGIITGISVDNFHPAALTVGVIRGIVEELYDSYRQMCRLTGREARKLVGSGNGLRKNRLMRRMAEEIFGMELLIPVHQEEAACGAALSALVAAGRAASIRQAQERIAYLRG